MTGRRKLTYSAEKKDITVEKILEILPAVLREHDKNSEEINYLYNYYKGQQPILNKDKIVRPEINNIVLQNHAYEIVEFKKAYIYGEPVQYVQKGEKSNQKINPYISELNRYMEYEDKSTVDKDLAEWQYICGTGFKWVDEDSEIEEDDAPFEIRSLDPRYTFTVYSSGVRGEVLFSGHYSYVSETIQTENQIEFATKSRIITIYTDDFMCKIKGNAAGTYTIITEQVPVDGKTIEVEKYPLLRKGQRIIEYPLNNGRLGAIEIVMSILNAINRIRSNDLDGIEQFVQSLLVFVNQAVKPEDFKELLALGAVEINSNDPAKPADLKLLVNQLKHSETKIVIDDLYQAMLNILGIPRMTTKSSGGDTGAARELGDGWTMADERAKQDELSFKKSERKLLKTVLSICKGKGLLKGLKLSDIDIKFTRNKSDNLLVKTEGLLNMRNAEIPPDIAFTISGLFSDPNDVFAKAKSYYGENLWKQDYTANINKNISGGEGEEPLAQKTNEDGSVKNGSAESEQEKGTKKN